MTACVYAWRIQIGGGGVTHFCAGASTHFWTEGHNLVKPSEMQGPEDERPENEQAAD
jgi:hypothetical protein